MISNISDISSSYVSLYTTIDFSLLRVDLSHVFPNYRKLTIDKLRETIQVIDPWPPSRSLQGKSATFNVASNVVSRYLAPNANDLLRRINYVRLRK